ncbi:MAG: TolC family protein [Rhizomicrobium sp.]|jgi:NodT family efflux transporter outer membrane factor (OMF) lipoprotein
MKYLFQTASVVALAATTLGCSTPVPHALKPSDVPAVFTMPISGNADIWPKADWWNEFGSSELGDLIVEAKANNTNLAVAVASVLQAKAQAEIARASLFPDINLEGSAERQSSPASTLVVGGPPVKGNITQNSFGLSADASYALDFWGLAQDNLRAATESLKAAKFNQQVVALTVVEDVATTYFNVLSLRQQIAIAQHNVDAAKGILTITQAQVTNGIASNLNLAQQEALVDGVEATIPVLKEQEHEALFALAILLGRPPEGFDVKAQTLDGIKSPVVAPGLPSSLLERRPDVAMAEANLASAHANVDAARAAFFPAISLTGSGGLSSLALGTLFTGSSFGWGIGASLLQTLFDGGKLFGESDLAKAEQKGLIATYRGTVIQAFSDVETGLSQVSNYSGEEEALTREVKDSTEAFRIAELQYREGIVDLLTVLQTQQTLFTAEQTRAQAQLAHEQAIVGLYKAMGGGWTEQPKDVTQPIPVVTAPVATPPDSAAPASTTPVPPAGN